MREVAEANIRTMSAAGLKTFFNIMQTWKVIDSDARVLLGSPARSTFYNWKANPNVPLPHDTLERISYILGIYKALQVLLQNNEAADSWVKKPNAAPIFNGQSALQRMLSGNLADLFVTRQYLDAMRGGWA
ncbi:MAG: MbcA/ParS/Xre antitoxin family protein [Mariprofundaceae bacterium]|nr:MbcA/ParS/Xre antitoxin family protein [Mariprofundaceae bacterium]